MPVFLSQTMTVSRWFVTPMVAISFLLYVFGTNVSNFRIASFAHIRTASKISMGSCSTHRGRGWIWLMAVSCEQICSKCGFVRKIYSQKKKNKWIFWSSIFAQILFTLTTTRTILVSSLMTKINFPLSCIVLFKKKWEKIQKIIFIIKKFQLSSEWNWIEFKNAFICI